MIRKGTFDLTPAAPPCSSFSRALFSDEHFPNPMRDYDHPHGFPTLTAEDKRKVHDADILVAFSLKALRAAATAHCLGWLEFPEDLGSCRCGTPASLWQLEDARSLSAVGYHRGALYQCEWAEVPYKKPTGILTNIRGFVDAPHFFQGWPTFSENIGKDSSPVGLPWRRYTGPLPRQCVHNGIHPPLLGRDKTGGFKTSKTAEYPPDLCRAFADIMVSTLADHSPGQIASARPVVGVWGACLSISPWTCCSPRSTSSRRSSA